MTGEENTGRIFLTAKPFRLEPDSDKRHARQLRIFWLLRRIGHRRKESGCGSHAFRQRYRARLGARGRAHPLCGGFWLNLDDR